MPRRQCTYSGCNEIVTVPVGFRDSPRCAKHARIVEPTPKREYAHHHIDGKNIYHSYQWRKLRLGFVAQNPLCLHCEQYGIITAGYIVDHIVEIEDGGAIFDINNLQHLCKSCHNAKTAREKIKRGKKKSLNGFGNISDF